MQRLRRRLGPDRPQRLVESVADRARPCDGSGSKITWPRPRRSTVRWFPINPTCRHNADHVLVSAIGSSMTLVIGLHQRERRAHRARLRRRRRRRRRRGPDHLAGAGQLRQRADRAQAPPSIRPSPSPPSRFFVDGRQVVHADRRAVCLRVGRRARGGGPSGPPGRDASTDGGRIVRTMRTKGSASPTR